MDGTTQKASLEHPGPNNLGQRTPKQKQTNNMFVVSLRKRPFLCNPQKQTRPTNLLFTIDWHKVCCQKLTDGHRLYATNLYNHMWTYNMSTTLRFHHFDENQMYIVKFCSFFSSRICILQVNLVDPISPMIWLPSMNLPPNPLLWWTSWKLGPFWSFSGPVWQPQIPSDSRVDLHTFCLKC